MKKLDVEQREDLYAMLDHEGWPVLLNVLEQLIDEIGKSVLYYDTEASGQNGLCARQAKYAGARLLYTQLLATVDKIKAKKG